MNTARFDEPIRLVEATTKTVRIVDSQLPGFNGARMRADGILNFHHSEVAAVLRLEGARISGELCLDHATLGSGTGDIVLAAENLIVDGPLIPARPGNIEKVWTTARPGTTLVSSSSCRTVIGLLATVETQSVNV